MKTNVYPCKPQFYYIKVGLRGSKLYRHVFVMIFKVIIMGQIITKEIKTLSALCDVRGDV